MPELQSNSNRQAGYFRIQGQAEFVWDSGEGQLAAFLFRCAFFYSSPSMGHVGIRRSTHIRNQPSSLSSPKSSEL